MRTARSILLALVAGCGSDPASVEEDLRVAAVVDLASADLARALDARAADLAAADLAAADRAAPLDAPPPSPDRAPPPDLAIAPDLLVPPRPMGCVSDVTAGHHVYTCDGLKYDVEVPAQCLQRACGLVVDVHGFSMSARMEDANTNLRALGRQHGYVVIQPNANPAPPLAAWSEADDARVHAVMMLALAAWNLDRKRVHLTGFSQGGMMTFRFVCKYADLLASVAPAAGTACAWSGNQTPSRELPILFLHGTDDALVPFNTAVTQRDAIVKGWKMGAGQQIAGDAKFKRTRHTSPSGTVFEFLQHDYSAQAQLIRGHCFPGSQDANGGAPGQVFGFACLPPNAFTWGEEVMKFFIAHPRK